uniref:GID complex subunit 8 homolog n=1 Tax=Nothobranchius furzeri TaxID=105023 RepID=A0A8C6MCH8_NOTFU
MMSYAEKPEDVTKEEWMEKLNNVHIQRADMNRLIMNYLVTEGFKEAAEKFRMESGIEPSVDLDSLDERIKIREMILKGQIQEAIALINSLHPELLDTNRYLYFHLQQQHLIELIRLRETESALEFAQTQLAEQGEESRECLTEMERTLALLAFDNPEDSPFGDLLNMMQRQKVASVGKPRQQPSGSTHPSLIGTPKSSIQVYLYSAKSRQESPQGTSHSKHFNTGLERGKPGCAGL